MPVVPLFEVTYSQSPQVDREAGVIRGVRILGRVSRNRREYSDEALAQAARLYEGLGVNLNHPERPHAPAARGVEEGIGWLEAIAVRADGVYGDLHYFRAHPQADLLVEAAERNPRRFGLSHHAEGRVTQRQGRTVVDAIERVRSVDVVQNPATTSGLFEAHRPPQSDPLERPAVVGARGDGPEQATVPARESPPRRELAESVRGDERVAAVVRTLVVQLLEDDERPLAGRLEQALRMLQAHVPEPAARSESEPTLAQLLERLERIESGLRDPDRPPRPAASRPLFEPLPDVVKFPADPRAFAAAIRS